MKYFGTDGIRGSADEFWSHSFVLRVGNAIAKYIQNNCEPQENNLVVIGMDTRESSKRICNILRCCFKNAVFVGVLPTAGISYLTCKLGAQLGIVVTASHNPYTFNGVKVFNAKGRKLEESEEEKIEKFI